MQDKTINNALLALRKQIIRGDGAGRGHVVAMLRPRGGDMPRVPTQNEWESKAANLLKAELKPKGVTYAQLVEMLAGIGISEKEVNVANKLPRGKFSAAFMLQCLEAIGAASLRLD